MLALKFATNCQEWAGPCKCIAGQGGDVNPFLSTCSSLLEWRRAKKQGLYSLAPGQGRLGHLSLYPHPVKPYLSVAAAAAQGYFSLVSPSTVLPSYWEPALGLLVAFWIPCALFSGGFSDFLTDPMHWCRVWESSCPKETCSWAPNLPFFGCPFCTEPRDAPSRWVWALGKLLCKRSKLKFGNLLVKLLPDSNLDATAI